MSKYIVATLHDKEHFVRLQRKPNHGGEGIDYYIGFRADGSSSVESILFSSAHFTRDEADSWLQANRKGDRFSIKHEAIDLKGLTFDQVECLVQEAVDEQYPPIAQSGMDPGDSACRFSADSIWENRVLATRGYWCSDKDPNYLLFPYTLETDSDGVISVSLGKPTAMKLQAVGVDDPSLTVDVPPDVEADFSHGAEIQEAGRRNSKADAGTIKRMLTLCASLLSPKDIDNETALALRAMIGASKEGLEASDASWDGSKSRFTIDQLLRAVPAAIASWARAQAKAHNRDVIKSDLHLPYKEPDGTVNLAGVRNALSRLPQVKGVPADVLDKAKAELQAALNKGNKESEEINDPAFTEACEGMGGETFTEHFSAVIGESANFDEDNMVVTGVSVLGPVSKNQRRYPVEVQEAALPLFEGAKAYLNHPTSKEMSDPRRVQDLIGEHKNIRMSGDMTYSDLHLIDNATVREHLVPIIKNKPHLVGNSIVVRGNSIREKDGWEKVTKILAVRSIDVVAEPATTHGMYESESQTPPSEDTMDLKKLTLEELRAERPDLVAVITGDDKTKKESADSLVTLEAKVTDLQKALAERDAKLAAIEEEKKAIAKAALIESLIASAKLPNSAKYDTKDDKKVIRESFRVALEKCNDEQGMKELIGIWESTFSAVPGKASTKETPAFSPEKRLDEGTSLNGNGLSHFDQLFN